MSHTLDETPFSAPIDIRFVGILGGRYTFLKRSAADDAPTVAYACRTQSLSPTSASLVAPVCGPAGQGVNLFLEDVGFLKGVITRRLTGGFQLELAGGPKDRKSLAAKINWLKRRSVRQVIDKRDAPRHRPRNPSTHLYVGSDEYDCFVIDVSLSGAGVSAVIRPPLGTAVTFGTIAGHVVRHMDVGFGLQFDTVQTQATLERELNARRPAAGPRIAAVR